MNEKIKISQTRYGESNVIEFANAQVEAMSVMMEDNRLNEYSGDID